MNYYPNLGVLDLKYAPTNHASKINSWVTEANRSKSLAASQCVWKGGIQGVDSFQKSPYHACLGPAEAKRAGVDAKRMWAVLLPALPVSSWHA